jgi:hypothetical protein
MVEINIGDMCTSCGRDTGPGSGLYVNRISSGAEWDVGGGFSTDSFTVDVTGWMCVDCQCVPCRLCNEPVLDYVSVEIAAWVEWVHPECADKHGLAIME